jgi:hypothetical protein
VGSGSFGEDIAYKAPKYRGAVFPCQGIFLRKNSFFFLPDKNPVLYSRAFHHGLSSRFFIANNVFLREAIVFQAVLSINPVNVQKFD